MPIALPLANQFAKGIESQIQAPRHLPHRRVKFNEGWYYASETTEGNFFGMSALGLGRVKTRWRK
jgi:hypothetical protein